jgi:two-component system, OmpR family, phosphate regulon response regulator PhoB
MPLRPPVVLIVADEAELMAMYVFGLLAIGFQPVTATTVDEAFMRAQQVRPDAVVTDMMRSGSSAVDLTRRLRADSLTMDAAILILSDHPATARQSAFGAGCDRIVLKPCYPDALALVIQEALAARRGAHQPLPPGD